MLTGLTSFRGGYARMNCALTGHTDNETISNGFKCDVCFCFRSSFPMREHLQLRLKAGGGSVLFFLLLGMYSTRMNVTPVLH